MNIKKFAKYLLHPFSISAKPIIIERAEQKFYIDYLRDGMTVFDIGANIGELSLLFSRFVGTRGQVHAFEPSSSVFFRLEGIIRLSKKENIIVNNIAVSDLSGEKSLYIYSDHHSGWNTFAQRPLTKYGINIKPIGSEMVKSTTVDKYSEQNKITSIDLLKIDVEGFEYQVLLGARRMFDEKRIKLCVFEFGATTFDAGNSPREIKRFFHETGYSLRNLIRRDPIFPGASDPGVAKYSMHIARPK